MNRNDIWTVVTVAVGTAALTVTALWPDSLDAGDGPQPLAPMISKARLVASGIEFTLNPAKERSFSAGEDPVFELVALNTNSSPAQATVHLAMSATSPADALSRVVRTPSILWRTDHAVVLGPGESKTFILQAGIKLPANNLISVLLQDAASPLQPQTAGANLASGSKVMRPSNAGGVVALSFSTAVPRGDQSLVSSVTTQEGQAELIRKANVW